MGISFSICSLEYDNEFDWRRQIINSCKEIQDQYRWASIIITKISGLENQRNIFLRDLILMNVSFQQLQLESARESVNNDTQHSKNIKKFLRRTGMTEDDILSMRERSFASSYLSETQSYVYHEKACQVNTTTKQSLDYFAHFTDIIKQQLKNNELGIIAKTFKKELFLSYNDHMKSLQQFSQILYSAIVSYYDIENFKFQMPRFTALINNDTMINFVTNYLMQDKEIYSYIFQHTKQAMISKVNSTTTYLQSHADITCHEANILKQFQQNHLAEPYLLAIKTLQKLNDKQGPASKAKVIITLAQVVTTCMKMGCEKNQVIQSDDVLPIYRYIVIKSQLYDIDVHIELMQKLLTQNVLSSNIGYFLTTLSAVLQI